MRKKAFLSALTDTIPVLAGYIVLGTGFGLIMKAHGYGLGWSLAMAVFIYAGSMQYALVPMLGGAVSLWTVALTTLLINMRHLFYGISMLESYRKAGRARAYLIFALTDETYSLVCRNLQDVPDKGLYYRTVSGMDHLYWVTGCVLGSILGEFVPFCTDGIDFALTALFLTVFTEQWLQTKNHLPALIGLGASVASLVLFGRDAFLLPSMLTITVLILITRGRNENACA